MTYEEAIEKVAKLLRLAQSNNANQSALAASRAQEIIDKYRIEAAALELETNGTQSKPDEPIKDFGADLMDAESRKLATWRQRLFTKIAKMNGCKGYVDRKRDGTNYRGIAIVGQPSNAATVRYLYAWLRSEVDRLANRDCRGFGHTYANNYRNGVVDTIALKLQAAQKESIARIVKELTGPATVGQPQPLALIRVEAAVAKIERQAQEVQEWMDENLNLRSGSTSYFHADHSAREAGRIAGREIHIRKPKAQLE
jgi:hypothetical protein